MRSSKLWPIVQGIVIAAVALGIVAARPSSPRGASVGGEAVQVVTSLDDGREIDLVLVDAPEIVIHGKAPAAAHAAVIDAAPIEVTAPAPKLEEPSAPVAGSRCVNVEGC